MSKTYREWRTNHTFYNKTNTIIKNVTYKYAVLKSNSVHIKLRISRNMAASLFLLHYNQQYRFKQRNNTFDWKYLTVVKGWRRAGTNVWSNVGALKTNSRRDKKMKQYMIINAAEQLLGESSIKTVNKFSVVYIAAFV